LCPSISYLKRFKGSGGVGTYAVQSAKKKGAFIAAISTQEDMLKKLGIDKVIN